MQILDGQKLAAKIRKDVKEEIKRLGLNPGLAVILVGANPASHLYVGLKEKAAKQVGIHFEKHVFSGTEPQGEILAKIQELNERADIHGILVQVPLPKNYNEDVVIAQIDPKKDVDGFHQVNLRAIIGGEPKIFPAVALAIVALLDAALYMARPSLRDDGDSVSEHLHNKTAIILVNRMEFAAPLEYLLTTRGAEVEIILRAKEITPDIAVKLRAADVLITARGRAGIVKGEMLKNGAIVIDAGINKLPDGRTVGDVDYNSTKAMDGFITPVPGGVGPMTVAMLLKNTLELAKTGLSPIPKRAKP